MDFKDFLSIRATIFESKIAKYDIFYGLIGKNIKEKKTFEYKGLNEKLTLNQVIDFELKEKGKNFLSLKAIKEIILELDLDSLLSETTMNDRFMIFIDKIGDKKNYTLEGEKHFSYVKSQIPIIIFILIELGTSKTLLNMYTTQAKDRITYTDLKVFFYQLYNFLKLYIDDLKLKEEIYSSFISHFKFDMLVSYKTNLIRLDNLYKIMDGYEKIETLNRTRRKVSVDRFNYILKEVFNELEDNSIEDIRAIEKINGKSENLKFSFLQSIGY